MIAVLTPCLLLYNACARADQLPVSLIAQLVTCDQAFFRLNMGREGMIAGYSVGRALHRYRRGHGFESRTGLNFFQALFSQLLNFIYSLVFFAFYGYTTNSQSGQLPVGLVEHCTGISEVMGPNPVQA